MSEPDESWFGCGMKTTTNLDKNTLAGFVAIVLWSTTVALARSISEQVGPLTSAAAVYLTGGILLLVKEFALKERSLKNLGLSSPKHFWGCGALFLIYTVALFLGLGLANDRIQTLEIGLINYLWTALTILFSLLFFSIKARLTLIPATLLSLVGIALVVTQGADISLSSFLANIQSNPVAYSLGATAAVSWGLYSNLTRLWAGSKNANSVSFFIFITGLVLLLLCLFQNEQGNFTVRALLEIAALGLFTALAYVSWDRSMQKGNASLVAACAYLTPFLSTVVSCVYLEVMPGAQLWIGCLMIITGSYISWKSIS